jgi:hypothetical protein
MKHSKAGSFDPAFVLVFFDLKLMWQLMPFALDWYPRGFLDEHRAVVWRKS